MRELFIGIFLFFSLVLIHELGHFIAAKKSGVKVLEFGIGIPPKIGKIFKDKQGTEYTINALPLGGFVRLKGEDPNNYEDFNAKDSFIQAKFYKKVIIISAGVVMNLVSAWIIFTGIFTYGTNPISILPENAIATQSNSYLMPTFSFLEQKGLLSGVNVDIPVEILETIVGSIGQKIGLQTGDILKSINNEPVSSTNIGLILKSNIGKDIKLEIQRGDNNVFLDTRCPDQDCILGIIMKSEPIKMEKIKFPLPQAMLISIQEIGAQTRLTLSALGTLGKNLFSFNSEKIQTSLNKLTGPAGAIKFGGLLLENGGRVAYLGFAGMISLALAIFNILPIPALDGGRLLGIIIQKVFGLKPEKYFTIEGYINIFFFIILLILGVYILLKDLVKFWGINIPFLG